MTNHDPEMALIKRISLMVLAGSGTILSIGLGMAVGFTAFFIGLGATGVVLALLVFAAASSDNF